MNGHKGTKLLTLTARTSIQLGELHATYNIYNLFSYSSMCIYLLIFFLGLGWAMAHFGP